MKAILAGALIAAALAACASVSTDSSPNDFPRTPECSYPGAAVQCRGLNPG
jgi:hypothetical protein